MRVIGSRAFSHLQLHGLADTATGGCGRDGRWEKVWSDEAIHDDILSLENLF
jgi:hypothetical protein